ncbi:capsule assembly Wzi family protein [Arcicella sp. LKC2W]|uniref:capsule assembly Wzi family protein n=1 Tax=Arcicella sp. LKC2W TaxID=2984198 RepID=UPI002B1F6774|nr:capsule assembly Wzi family protein [Arcicella sp. LKC2W]MEA5461290.1 capsule assembly Wzi family protein [Arcicella sp. LKC2W]
MKAVFTIFLSSIFFNLFAQSEEVKREIKYTAEIGTILSTNGETPFWLRANQYGIVPSQSPILTLRGTISSDYKKAITKEDHYKLSKFDWGYGLNVVGNIGNENQVLIPEAYVKAKYGAFEIYAGRRKEIFGLVDTTLSSGSYIWSGNAMPIPKIQISTPNFVPLGFTKSFLSFKGNYAHGWFENNRTDVKNFYLHQKSLYFRLGKPDWKFHFYGGFNHQVQWGGELLYPDPKNQSGIGGKVGSSFNDYTNVILGRSLGAEGDTSKVGGYEATNRSGNHLGTLDFGFDVSMKSFSILIYRQSIFEDGSLAYLSNITDGLNGVSITNKKKNDSKLRLQKVVFEYLNTLSQGGAIGSYNTNSRLRGGDNYFNNGVYRDGWSYNQTSIGTAFINNTSIIITNAPNLFFNNNRVEAFYLGIFGTINSSINSEIRISNSRNAGTYPYPLVKVKNQFSGLMSLNYSPSFLENSMVKLSVSMDNGEFYNDNYCFHLGLKKNW